MTATDVDASEFEKVILENWKIVDVRSPNEFALAELPNSVNLPILENSERERVGTCFRQHGREAAIKLGHELVSGETKSERIKRWTTALNNEKSLITCWRGGLRSQISQGWAAEAGTARPRLKGGYKAFRNFLLEKMESIIRQRDLLVVSGTTGSGKTLCLREAEKTRPVLDMEWLGRHRGSAFGAYDEAQPAQATYENRLATELVKINERFPFGQLILEDESRMLGKLVNPEFLFDKLRASPVVVIEETLRERIEVIFADYILAAGLTDPDRKEAVAHRYRNAMLAISKKLGGLRYSEVAKDFEQALANRPEDHRFWIEKLLIWYYDPLYIKSLENRKPEILFRGNRKEVTDFLLSQSTLQPSAAVWMAETESIQLLQSR